MPQDKIYLKPPRFADELLPFLSPGKNGDGVRVAVISEKVAGCFPGLAKELENSSVRVILWKDGESAKTSVSKEKLEKRLLEKGVSRSSAIAAVGGGTILDLCGFAASTLLRGVEWVAVPTTLLAMVDASIGGKTGINIAPGKNLVGSFHFPKDTLIWLPFLDTLPKKEFINGIAECLKHGLIADEGHYLEVLNADLDNRPDLKRIIRESQKIKIGIVEKDPYERRGERNLLNFGHTVGHGLENYFRYRMPHGRAVALGMAWELALSTLDGYCESLAFKQVKDELFRLVKPDKLDGLDLDRLWNSMSFDKKRGRESINYVPLRGVGAPALSSPHLSPLKFDLLKKSYGLLTER